MFLFFHVEDNGIDIGWICLLIFKINFLTLPNFDFITAQSSLIIALMGSVTPLF